MPGSKRKPSDQRHQIAQLRAAEPVAATAPLHRGSDEPRRAKLAQMIGDQLLAHPRHLLQLPHRARAPGEPRGPCGIRVRGPALKPRSTPMLNPVAIPRALPAPLMILLSARFRHLCHHQLRSAIDYTPMHYQVITAAGVREGGDSSRRGGASRAALPALGQENTGGAATRTRSRWRRAPKGQPNRVALQTILTVDDAQPAHVLTANAAGHQSASGADLRCFRLRRPRVHLTGSSEFGLPVPAFFLYQSIAPVTAVDPPPLRVCRWAIAEAGSK